MIRLCLVALVPAAAALSAPFAAGDRTVRFRAGAALDMPFVFRAMAANLMNPLSLQAERFLVADDAAQGDRVGFGQIRPLGGDAGLWELASVYVEESWRGRGVGGELVRRLLEAHVAAGRRPADVHMLTLAKTAGWYRTLGFEQVPLDRAPSAMGLEMAAGSAITRLLGEELVCMRCVGEV